MTQEELNTSEEAFAKDLLERSLSTELIEVGARKPASRDLGDLADFARHCQALGIPPLPATPAIVGMYLLTLIHEGRSERAVTKTARAIEFAHDCSGHSNPVQSRWVKAVMRINRTHSRATEVTH
jgi:hypothetical protein